MIVAADVMADTVGWTLQEQWLCGGHSSRGCGHSGNGHTYVISPNLLLLATQVTTPQHTAVKCPVMYVTRFTKILVIRKGNS